MSQLSLFQSEKTAAEPRPVNKDLVRKYLLRHLRLARNAVIMPWHASEMASLERRFPDLAALLDPEEGTKMLTEFQVELDRLKMIK